MYELSLETEIPSHGDEPRMITIDARGNVLSTEDEPKKSRL